MPVIDGKALSLNLRAELKKQVSGMDRPPGLGIVLTGGNPESDRYVRLKKQAVEEIGCQCTVHRLPQANENKLISIIDMLNEDPDIQGILVQLPLPGGLEPAPILKAIRPEKDVDGLTPLNLGLCLSGQQLYTGCGAWAVLYTAQKYLAVQEPRTLLLGSSYDLIKPLAAVLAGRGWEFTVKKETGPAINYKEFDLVVVEQGEPQSLKAEQFRKDSLVIDAGFYWQDGRTVGNVQASTFAEPGTPWLLPVPGGLGPLLITMLLANLVKAGRML